MTNSEQALREKAINIFADIFAAGGEAHEVGGQSFDQLQQSGYIDRKITDLTALISEGYYPKEFTEWYIMDRHGFGRIDDKLLLMNVYEGSAKKYTIDDMYEYWKENER